MITSIEAEDPPHDVGDLAPVRNGGEDLEVVENRPPDLPRQGVKSSLPKHGIEHAQFSFSGFQPRVEVYRLESEGLEPLSLGRCLVIAAKGIAALASINSALASRFSVGPPGMAWRPA